MKVVGKRCWKTSSTSSSSSFNTRNQNSYGEPMLAVFLRSRAGFAINQTTMPTLLAIETSCDETGVALLRWTSSSSAGQAVEVLASAVASQVDVHALTGGVVPEVAAREHLTVINPLITEVLNQATIRNPKDDLDALAVTVGPGLIPALVVGVQTARTLAYAWDKPLVPIHHIEGHVYSALLNTAVSSKQQAVSKLTTDNLQLTTFPALALIVSGGHTMLIKISDHLQYEVLGQTRDDAAGEAFDKVARLLELPYPGGPHLSRLAEQGDPTAFDFARPMLQSGDLDFSFSGLKTEVLYTVREIANPSGPAGAGPPPLVRGGTNNNPSLTREGRGVGFRANVAASFQQAVVDSLISKTKQALKRESYSTLLLAGGVAANKLLRKEVTKLAETEDIELRVAPLELCGDNAVMIGQVAMFAHQAGRQTDWKKIDASARLPLETFSG